ncbi:MAG: chorismate synthase [Bacteroidales bacterium]|nr:chorismate synthase [Bacteroidales bacterium]
MNTFGTNFRFTSFGESHGLAVGGIIDGCPSRLALDTDAIRADLARRRGEGDETTTRREADEVEFLSGVMDGITLGTPIAFAIRNADTRPDDYEELRHLCRPGHADFTYQARYGIRDHRGGGRASGRETAARVVAGAIAKQLLAQRGIGCRAAVAELAPQTPDDTRGGSVRCVVQGLPAGVGDPVFGRLNAMLAAAMMSIPSSTAFEMGVGTQAADMTGSAFADQWLAGGRTVTNHCGGVQGGISNGMPVEFKVTFHAVPTLPHEVDCLADDGTLRRVNLGGRHDTCHILRLPVVVEAMAALTIVNLIDLKEQ